MEAKCGDLALAVDRSLEAGTTTAGSETEDERAYGDIMQTRGAESTMTTRSHQIPVIRFYAKLGYVEEGPRFDEEGEPHQLMVRDLPL